MRVVLLGPPGAGKGTQAARLAEVMDVPHLATGDILRGEVAAGSGLGVLANQYMERGDLVPDDMMVRMLLGRLDGTRQGFILDGFPRTLAQAEALDQALQAAGTPVERMIYLDVATGELMRRLLGRYTCSQCQAPYHIELSPPTVAGKCDRCSGEVVQRPDDRPDAVPKRLRVYDQQTVPVLDFYRRTGRVREIDGEGAPDEVHERLFAAAS